ncbi:hypothetical protein YC2023_101682 [Brassica napus]
MSDKICGQNNAAQVAFRSRKRTQASRRGFDHLFWDTTSVTPRFPGVRPGYRKRGYGHVSTHLYNPTCSVTVDGRINFFEIPSHPYPYTSTYSPAHREMEREEMSNKLLSEVTLDQPARMTLYTTLCGN